MSNGVTTMRILPLAGATLLAILAGGLLALVAVVPLAHSQTIDSQRFGDLTVHNGTDQRGGSWSGTTLDLGGGFSSTHLNGPHGQTQSCTTVQLGGGLASTICN